MYVQRCNESEDIYCANDLDAPRVARTVNYKAMNTR